VSLRAPANGGARDTTCHSPPRVAAVAKGRHGASFGTWCSRTTPVMCRDRDTLQSHTHSVFESRARSVTATFSAASCRAQATLVVSVWRRSRSLPRGCQRDGRSAPSAAGDAQAGVELRAAECDRARCANADAAAIRFAGGGREGFAPEVPAQTRQPDRVRSRPRRAAGSRPPDSVGALAG
jgi:hypothetical protein